MDANLNNPAAALITASQAAQGKLPGAAPGLPGGKNDAAIGHPDVPAGESEFSNKFRSLQKDSVKETRASEAASSSTEAPRAEAATAADAPAESTEPAARAAGDDQPLVDESEPPAADGDGKSLPATGKDLPVAELMTDGDAESGQLPTTSDELETSALSADVSASTPVTDSAAEVAAPVASAVPVADAPDDPDAATPPAATTPEMDIRDPEQNLAAAAVAGNTTAASPSNAAGAERGAAAPTVASPAPVGTGGVGAAATGTRSDSAGMNYEGSGSAQSGLPNTAETPAPTSTATQRVAFSAETPTLAAATGASPAVTTSAAATLAELDTLAGARPLQPQAGQEQFARGLGERMLLMADGGLQSARIKLSPENLGPLDIRIQVQDDATQVWFNASQGQTREILEQAMPRLRELLADQGMRLTDANVSGGENGSTGEAPDESGAPERDWRVPPPLTREERLAGRSLHQLIEARRLLDVYA